MAIAKPEWFTQGIISARQPADAVDTYGSDDM
jgi:hypothetical protein